MKYLLPALASVIAAIITTLGTIAISRSKIDESQRQITALQAQVTSAVSASDAQIKQSKEQFKTLEEQASTLGDLTRLPVGSIVASLLPPQDLAVASGDPPNFDLAKSRWTLADDKGPLPGTRWAQLTQNKPIPDLRGVFLRGLNLKRDAQTGDPHGQDREPGDYQQDAVGPHTHIYRFTAGKYHVWGGGSVQDSINAHPEKPTSPPVEPDGVETRPRNVAVFYYVRIN